MLTLWWSQDRMDASASSICLSPCCSLSSDTLPSSSPRLPATYACPPKPLLQRRMLYLSGM